MVFYEFTPGQHEAVKIDQSFGEEHLLIGFDYSRFFQRPVFPRAAIAIKDGPAQLVELYSIPIWRLAAVNLGVSALEDLARLIRRGDNKRVRNCDASQIGVRQHKFGQAERVDSG